ncbi:MAG: 50S ribosomal protein L30 [Deltaproteobacteria bacterium]|nr:50S ribosomal protein L30 [Deltaproteobacteria bacterium]
MNQKSSDKRTGKKGRSIILPAEVTVRQTRSSAGRTDRVKDTLSALGLGRIGKQRSFKNPNQALMGLIRKVDYLLEVSEK